MAKQPAGPIVRVAPLGELRAYTVFEHELDRLAKGTAGSLYLNFALALLSAFVTLLATLVTLSIPPGYAYQSFFSLCVITLIAGLVLMAAWWVSHESSSAIVVEIKQRMPPPEGTQGSPSGATV